MTAETLGSAAWRAKNVAVLAVGMLAVGCQATKDFLGSMEKPSARVQSVTLKALDLQGATLQFDVDVSNPYSVPLPVAGLDVALASRGSGFFNAESKDSGTIEAKASRTFPVSAKISFVELLGALKGVRPGGCGFRSKSTANCRCRRRPT